MTLQIFILLLAAFSSITALLTQAVKMFLTSIKVNTIKNVLVLIIAIIVGTTGMVFYYLYQSLPFDAINIFLIVFMVVANWLSAMLGYDKVVETITQLRK